MTNDVDIPLSLPEEQAQALAQFVKRVDRETASRHAGDPQEADEIFESFIALRSALAAAGFAPR